MACGKPTPADLIKALQHDRLINITVGADSTPFQVQQSVLEGASEWFAKALKRDAFVEGKSGKLHFAEDDRESWEVLIYWIVRHEFQADLEDNDGLVLCAKCWALGHKYDIKRFQDEAMMTLIRHFNKRWLVLDVHELNEILAVCPPKSKLGRILAEEIVHNIHQGPALDWEFVGRLNIGSFITELGEAQAKLIGNSRWEFSCRLGGSRGQRSDDRPWWTQYMVGDKIDWPVKEDEED